MRRKRHHGSSTPAELRSASAKHNQGDSTAVPMAPNKHESAAHHRHNSSYSSVSQDDGSADADPHREPHSPHTNAADSHSLYNTYTSSVPRIEHRANYHEVEEWVSAGIELPACMNNPDTCHVLASAAAIPPVTPETLKELDLQWIQNNINLRVDVHYDHDLHFMPISGRRGEEKRTEAQIFWRALEVEMRIHHHNCLGPCPNCSWQPAGSAAFTFNQRLPVMFSKLKALLLILVPNNDHERVSDALDVGLLMQQVEKGVLDVVRLSRWLSDLLTTHCAPIRDEWALEMTSKVSEGVQQNDMSSLVAGLEKLFSFCEAMKLDVANHQIRTFRLPLIEDGIPFQRDYFQTRMRLGKLDPWPSLRWFGTKYRACLQIGLTNSDYSPIVHGLVWLVLRPKEEVPELLRYDYSRISQLREEVSDFVHLDICCDYLGSRLHGQHDTSQMQTFKTRLLDLTDGECTQAADSNAIWHAHLEAISAEITRATFATVQPSTNSIPAAAFARSHKELLAQFQQAESRLDKFAQELQQRLLKHASIFHQLSALHISEMQQQHQQSRQNGAHGRHVPGMDDIARRLAHMAVIHWRVWCDLYVHAQAIGVSGGELPDTSLTGGQGNGQ